MPAAKIMLIRHAEKPNGDGGPGLMPNGVENPRALTLTGWKRANALVGLFNPADGASPKPPLAKPRSLFASGSESLRPKQTIAPLATALNLSVRSFLKGQEPQLVAAVRRPKTRFSFPGNTRRSPRLPTSFAAARRAFRRSGPATASISSGCSTFRPPAPGVLPRFLSSSCRATPTNRSAPATERFPPIS